MHIKRVSISGFKTYRTETIIDDFTPHCNLVLGKNGSGKSNLLDAIQFVLTDKYVGLTSQERTKLLHEGAGGRVAQADVEVVFDNSDKRIPLEASKSDKSKDGANEVRIRRTIGSKKDQYLVNDTPYSQVDFQNLLESAGMSRSNPYYIVEQGKISTLMKQSKAQRLELLKEIAGTRTYDERKKESMKIMKDTDGKLKQIDTVVGVLESRLKELEEESAEFKKFLTLDTTRRALEYAIYEQERENATAKLESIDAKRASGSSDAQGQGTKYTEAQKAVEAAEEEIEQLQAAMKKAQASKKTLTQQETSLLKRRTELELGIKDMKAAISGARGSKEEAASDLKKLQKQLKDTHTKLDKLTSEYTTVAAEEEKLTVAYQRIDQRLTDLASKRDRSAKYSSRKDRDADLKKQIARVTKERAEVTKQIEKHQKEISDAQKQDEAKSEEIQKKEAQIESNRQAADKLNEQLVALADKRDTFVNTRKAAWKRQAELMSEFTELQQKMDKARRNQQATMDKDLYHGVQASMDIAKELGIDGVYGPLISLFTCPPEYNTCVEITAGNSLFQVVVDTDATAARLIKELLTRKLGRVTFTPLDRINPQEPPEIQSNDAFPMMREMRFDAKYRKAMLQVFGKTLIARDLNVAAHMSQVHDINTITLGGDRVDKKGALTGGFSDLGERGRSRLAAQAEITQHQARYAEVQVELDTVTSDIAKIDAQTKKLDLSKLQDQKAELRGQNTRMTQEIKEAKTAHKTIADSIARNEKLLPPLRASLASIETQLESFESEMASEYRTGLTADEEGELKRLTKELDDSKRDLIKIRARKAETETSKVALEMLLNANLNRREEELNTRLNAATQDEESDSLTRDEQELAQLTTQINELEQEMKTAEDEMEKSNERVRKLQTNLDKLRAAASDAYAAMSEDAKEMDKLLSQRLVYQQKKEDAIKKIRELGALPNEAFEKYREQTQKQLFERLDKTRVGLKKFTGVNRKSIEQYTNFTEQRTDLIERKKELDAGRDSIMELMTHLDAKKEEAIQRTFKTIAHHFSEVFQEIVPGGKGTLVIETKLDEEDEGEQEEEEEKKSSEAPRRKKKARREEESMESTSVPTTSFTGIRIKVSFPGTTSREHQLSGGQESVVALSLIFAIQRCDPSPFYLLDEIDSALDPVYRVAVTTMLQAQCVTTQFICTTFHPEMVDASDRQFGVIYKNKATQIRVLDRNEALKLISVSEREQAKGQEQQEE